MKLEDPLTSDELDFVKRTVGRGATLGLFRHGEGDEKGTGVSLLEKLIDEYERMIAKGGRA